MAFKRSLLVVAISLLLTPALRAQISIDFNSDSTGAKTDPFTSADSSQVHFNDSIAEGLEVLGDSGVGDSQSLLNSRGDQDLAVNTLYMQFDLPIQALSLYFGNDTELEGGYVARLQGLDDTDGIVIQSSVTPNFNEDTDQQITVTSNAQRCFTNADFAFVDESGDPVDVEEIVDDVVATPCEVVPAAGTGALALLAASLLLGGALLLRRRAAVA